MFVACVVSALVVAASCQDKFVPLRDDAPEVKKTKQIIANVNHYLEDHLLTEIHLPNIGILPFDPVKLRNGVLGKFDTIRSSEDPVIGHRKNKDGSTTYQFDLKLNLKELSIHYDFEASIVGIIRRTGTFTLAPLENSLEASGVVVLGTDGSCDARLYSAAVEKFGTFKVDIVPNDIPAIATVYEAVLNFVTPKLIPLTNVALEAVKLTPGFQTRFSNYVCQQLTEL